MVVWYKPQVPGEPATVTTFKSEYCALDGMSLGNTRSNALQNACCDFGLQQKVAKLTYENHLLVDLLLTNIPGVTTKILLSISDHKLVVAELPFKVPERVVAPRSEWMCAKADWEQMRSLLKQRDCDSMRTMD